MEFQKAKSAILQAVRDDKIQHEARAAQAEKNLLATGHISKDQALAILSKTKGGQASVSAHHKRDDILVWVFRPDDWYIKFYLIEDAWFISFHKKGSEQ